MRKANEPRTELYDRAWMVKARTLLKATQSDIAKACNISQGAYNLIEQGLRTPNVRIGLQISKILGTSPDEWMNERRIA